MHEELKRQRIKGLVEVGGAADAALPQPRVSGLRWIEVVERYLRRHPVLKTAVAMTVFMSVAYSAWALVVAMK
jgi:hypothetical protein